MSKTTGRFSGTASSVTTGNFSGNSAVASPKDSHSWCSGSVDEIAASGWLGDCELVDRSPRSGYSINGARRSLARGGIDEDALGLNIETAVKERKATLACQSIMIGANWHSLHSPICWSCMALWCLRSPSSRAAIQSTNDDCCPGLC